jgi:hypothetical protein
VGGCTTGRIFVECSEPGVVTLTFARWNRIREWLSRFEALNES